MLRTLFPTFALLLAAPSAAQEPPAKATIPADQDPVTTASGLEYSVLRPGAADGAHPRPGDRVRVHYTGWLTDGVEFDSSRARGPAEFVLGGVIPGWNEALALMTTGARFKLTIPPALGYGAEGAPPQIPGNATLVFDVELLGFTAGPQFVKLDHEQAKATEGGVKYQVLAAGEGDEVKPAERIEMQYAVWTLAGGHVMNHLAEPRPVLVAIEQLRMPFMRELLGKLRAGGRCVAEVPVATAFPDANTRPPAFGDDKDCVWQLSIARVLRPLPVPEFKPSAAADLVKTASGLAWHNLREGTGRTPTGADTVRVHYVGWLEDGKVFDSSYPRGEEAEFALAGVIPGWSEGLQLMKEGGVAQFVIPADLAYGAEGRPPVIPGGATLVFRVELLAIR